jgi:hypothetical protein
MKSYNVPVHNETDRRGGGLKKQWVKPSVEIIALESAENGNNPVRPDGGGSHFSRTRS